jgi:hypothetical protein
MEKDMSKNEKVEPKEESVAEKIWNEIKNKEIQMFSLPGKVVSDFCKPIQIEPSRCFLLFKASAVLPALEEAIGKAYECEAMDKYIVITRKKNGF